MSDRDDFLAWVNSRVRDAEIAVHDGDAGPRREIWSRQEPVTVLGAWKSATGRAELDELFTALEQSFSGCTSFRFDVVAAEVSSDMAYTVGYDTRRPSSMGSRAPTRSARRRSTGASAESGRWSMGTAARRQTMHRWSGQPFGE